MPSPRIASADQPVIRQNRSFASTMRPIGVELHQPGRRLAEDGLELLLIFVQLDASARDRSRRTRLILAPIVP